MIYLIQGPPGAGKSHVGQYLSEKLSYPYFSKDNFKEILFDTLGTYDKVWSAKLAVASNALLFSMVEKAILTSSNLIVETNITKTDEVQTFKIRMSGHEQLLTEIFITAEPSVLLKRVKERWDLGSRHTGHADDQRFTDIGTYISNQVAKPIEIGNKRIHLDSSTLTKSELIADLCAKLGISK